MIELRPHVGRNAVSGEQVHCPQYLILMDGKHIGFLPYRNGAKPLLFVALGPIEMAEMVTEIEDLLPGESKLQPAVTAPEPPTRKPQPDDDVDPFSNLEDW
jgi:hypothetical protein